MKNLLGRKVCIDGKDGGITNILGCGYEITFFKLKIWKNYGCKTYQGFLKSRCLNKEKIK